MWEVIFQQKRLSVVVFTMSLLCFTMSRKERREAKMYDKKNAITPWVACVVNWMIIIIKGERILYLSTLLHLGIGDKYQAVWLTTFRENCFSRLRYQWDPKD